MDAIVKKEIIKGIALAAILTVFNVNSGFNLTSVSLSILLILLFIAGDAWILAPLRKKIYLISKTIDDLAAGEKDLTKKIEIAGNDEISMLGQQFNAFIGRLHNVIGQSLNTSNQAASASADLSKFSSKMADGATAQSSQAAQIAAAMDELNTTVNEVARNTQTVADSAKQASDIAEEGGKTVFAGIEGLKKVTASVENSSKIITELGQRAASIGEILSLIEDIADQTNLLALNAAIEAARAGEQGRGFAVVADEVRKLAERTTKATREISAVIKSLQDKTDDAVKTMGHGVKEAQEAQEFAAKISGVLERIVEASRNVSDTIQQIATAVEEQSSATEDVSMNVEKISSITQDTARNAMKASDASVELNRLSDELLKEVGSFKMNLFGVVPLENAVVMNKKYAPLVAYLNNKLGMDYIIKVGKDYTEAIEDVGTGRVQISSQTPTTYIEGKHKHGIKLLGYFAKDGSPTYKSAIVVSKNSGIRSIAELKGKRFAFGSEKSTGSTLVPMAMLAEGGITLNDLSQHAFLGSHDIVANAVLKGEFDAGGMMESVVADFADKGIVAIKISEPIPQFPICVNKDLDPEFVANIKEALISITDSSILKAIDKGYTKFLEAKDSDFDGVRVMVKRLYNVEYR
ncbi:MAG: phosphate/phosphite/phosphonate ABC transporter substrate-binding protein [Nitrospirae bacterium]|nr:phosphate/phosphite/phosphonate ABC transporter substrate-binding protein [Nitrospirota bacterium]